MTFEGFNFVAKFYTEIFQEITDKQGFRMLWHREEKALSSSLVRGKESLLQWLKQVSHRPW